MHKRFMTKSEKETASSFSNNRYSVQQCYKFPFNSSIFPFDNVTSIFQSSYSLDRSYHMCFFFLFPRIEMKLEGRCFGGIETVKANNILTKTLWITLSKVAEMLNQLDVIPMGLLRRTSLNVSTLMFKCMQPFKSSTIEPWWSKHRSKDWSIIETCINRKFD